MTRGKRVVVVLLVLMFGVVTSAVVGVAVFFDTLVRMYVVHQAQVRGVLLEPGEIDLTMERAAIANGKFRLAGVVGVEASFDRMVITLRDWKPSSVRVQSLDIQAQGSASYLFLWFSQWSKDHREAYQVPLTAATVKGAWRVRPEDAPWLTFDGAQVAPTPQGGALRVEKVTVLGKPIGAVGASWTSDQANVALGLGRADVTNAPLRLQMKGAPIPTEVRMELVRTPMTELSMLLGKTPFPPGVDLEVTASLDAHSTRQMFKGNVKATLHGWRPPHPKELGRVLHANNTTLESTLETSLPYQHVSLREIVIQSGDLKLRGDGELSRASDYATFNAKTKGSIPCARLAQDASQARVGGMVGELIGTVSGMVTSGTVDIEVSVAGDTRSLGATSIKPKIGIGCGLRIP